MAPNDAIIEVMPASEKYTSIEKSKQDVMISESEVTASPANETPHLRRVATGQRRTTFNSLDKAEYEIDGTEDGLSFLGKCFKRLMSAGLVVRYLVYFLPGAFLLAIPLIIYATVKKDAHAGNVRLYGLFVWLELFWVAMWITKLGAKAFPYIAQFGVGIVSASTRAYAEFIKALEFPISLLLWFIVAWATVPVIRQLNMAYSHDTTAPTEHDWIDTLQKVFCASIPASAVYLIEKMFVQLIAVNYHRKQFASKIDETKSLVLLLAKLYKVSKSLFPDYHESFEEEDWQILNSNVAAGIKTGKGQAKLVLNIARVGSGVTSVFNNIASEVVGGRKLNPNSDEAIVICALEKRVSAQALARRLWRSLAADGAEALYEADLVVALGEEHMIEAEHMFRRLDRDRNGDVSLEEMEHMLVGIEQEQKKQIKSIYDVKHALAALDRILLVAVLIGIALIYGAFFSQNFLKNLTLLTTSIMSFSFAFAGTVQEFAGSCIFIFIKHPYDIGDRVDIDDIEMVVQHISLLYTVFRRCDSNKTVQIPNQALNANWIENVTRSAAMKERITIEVSADKTSAEDLELLRAELQAFVTHPDHKRDFQPHVGVDVRAIGDLKSLELQIEYGHKTNWANDALRLTRRARFMTALVAALKLVPIYCPGGGYASLGSADSPSYSVAVTDEQAAAARAHFDAQQKDGKLETAILKKKQQHADISYFRDVTEDEDEMTATGTDFDRRREDMRRRSAVAETLAATSDSRRRKSSDIRGLRS